MKVFVRWLDDDGNERSEITKLVQGQPIFIEGTSHEVDPTMFGNMVMLEDDFGLWCLMPDQVLELRRADTNPSVN